MPRRYLFLGPSGSRPSGGVAVIYETAALLREIGLDACVLNHSAGSPYRNTKAAPPVYYTNRVSLANMKVSRPRAKSRIAVDLVKARFSRDRLEELVLKPTDVIVAPEYLFSSAARAFPKNPVIVLVQNPFSYLRDLRTGQASDPALPQRAVHAIGTSESCLAAIEIIGEMAPASMPVGPDMTLFQSASEKRRKIVLMPRKRRDEATTIISALKRRGRVSHYDIVRLENLPQHDVARELSDALIFVSLMREESLGFPAIEAMASGCITVGYTGFGGREYFNAGTGVVIEEGDTSGLIAAIEDVVAEYDRDPARLDAMRQHAADVVKTRYDPAALRQKAVELWTSIDQQFESGMKREAS